MTKFHYQIFFISQGIKQLAFLNSCLDVHVDVINFRIYFQSASINSSVVCQREKRGEEENTKV